MWLVVSLAIVGALAATILLPKFLGKPSESGVQPDLYEVKRTVFNHNVIEPGEVESSQNTEIRCEVQSRNTTGIMILEILPNGTFVQPGDLLFRFDSSALEKERNQQQILCNTSQAAAILSKANYETAVITKKEYLEGTNKQEEQIIQSEIFVAEENLRRAEEYARYSERLAARGYVTGVQVEADRFAVEKTRKELETAQTKLRVLRDFTKEKMMKTLDANIETYYAKLQADENSYTVEQNNLKMILSQIDKCSVKSPVAGKVVYANSSGGRGSQEVIIQEGTIVRERQPVVRIPDLQKMQVMAKINESRISFIKEGMTATVRLDAFPDMELTGKVTRVEEYPLPPGWMSSNVKQYATYVQIDNPPGGMVRPGLTANVEIHISTNDNAVALPISAVLEHQGEYYCLIKKGDRLLAQWIALGSSNVDLVEIREGIDVGQQVVINPDLFLAGVDFPAPPPGKSSSLNQMQLAQKYGKAGGGKGGGGNPGESGKRGKSGGGESGPSVAGMFDRLDVNHDNVITVDEIPPERAERINAADENGDGKIEKVEFLKGMQRPPAEREGRSEGNGTSAAGSPGSAAPGGAR